MSALQKKLVAALSLLLVVQAGFNLVRYLQEVQAGAAFGGDFVCFWNAATRARLGDFAAIYPAQAWRAALASHAEQSLAWFVYPPFSLFGLQFLGRMTYDEAATWWSLAPLPLYFVLVVAHARRAEARLVRHSPADGARMGWADMAALAGLSAPWLSANIFAGQTGAILAVLFLAASWNLPRRPVVAGVLIGLVAIKPQLGLLFPFALAASGRWRAALAAGGTIAALVGLSLVWVGKDVWADYLAMTRLFSQFISHEHGRIDQLALAPYVSLRSVGVSVAAAAAAQAAISLAVLICVVVIFRRSAGEAKEDGRLDLRLGLLAVGALLSTPYALTYETPLLILAVIPFYVRAQRRGWDGWDLGATVALVLTPYGQMVFIDWSAPFGLAALLFAFGALSRRYLLEGLPLAAAASTSVREPSGGPRMSVRRV